MPDVSPRPHGYHAVTPYVSVNNPNDLLRFMEQVFDAQVLFRHDMPDGRLMHAEARIGDSPIMVSDACPQRGSMPASLYVYVEDVDATYRKALAAGAKSVMEPQVMFWGDRFASVEDPVGNAWSIAKQVEIVSPQEIQARAQQFAQQMSDPQQ